jgi:hypothetical protein
MSVTTSFANLIAAGLLLVATSPARAETPASLCGSKPEMVDIMLRMIEEGVEKLYSDNRMFVSRDNRDGSMWAITLPNTSAHPSAACRTKAKEAALLCSAGEKVCASFQAQAMARMDKLQPVTP